MDPRRLQLDHVGCSFSSASEGPAARAVLTGRAGNTPRTLLHPARYSTEGSVIDNLLLWGFPVVARPLTQTGP